MKIYPISKYNFCNNIISANTNRSFKGGTIRICFNHDQITPANNEERKRAKDFSTNEEIYSYCSEKLEEFELLKEIADSLIIKGQDERAKITEKRIFNKNGSVRFVYDGKQYCAECKDGETSLIWEDNNGLNAMHYKAEYLSDGIHITFGFDHEREVEAIDKIVEGDKNTIAVSYMDNDSFYQHRTFDAKTGCLPED